MTAQLAEISQAVAPGAHAVLLLDQAGWHVSPKLPVPANITLLPLPPRSPELNPVENIWQFVRDNWAVEPDFRLLRRNPRSRLRRVEQARRPALDHYVHRTARLGSRVLISARRYERHD
jgi:transposase